MLTRAQTSRQGWATARRASPVGWSIALCALALVCATPASATTGTWELTRDTTLTEPHFGSLKIRTPGVHLDCAGNLISGNQTGIGIQVLSAVSVVIENCSIEGFDIGIQILDSATSAVLKTSVEASLSGISIVDSERMLLRGNHVTGAVQGIVLDNSTSSSLADNSVQTGPRSTAFELIGASNNTLGGNIETGDGDGYTLMDSSNNQLSGNRASGEGDGYRLIDSNHNVLTANIADLGIVCIPKWWLESRLTSNSDEWKTAQACPFEAGAGFTLTGASNNALSKNRAFLLQAGVKVTLDSVQNTISQNWIYENQHGISICTELVAQNALPDNVFANGAGTIVEITDPEICRP